MAEKERSSYEYELVLNVSLSDRKLKHSDESDCKCDGKQHEMTIYVDLADYELHSDHDCFIPDFSINALQKLHEQAHPQGSMYVGNCAERSCRDILGELY